MKVLFKVWWDLPHSYAIVNACIIKHIAKKCEKVYIQNQKYFNPQWKSNTSFYPKEYLEILENIELYNNQEIDIIYSGVYPYDTSKENIPKVCFYTSEFSVLNPSYFSGAFNSDNIFFTAPSAWSANGLKGVVPESRNRVISHGVDTNVFFKKNTERTPKTLLSIGGMTGNKGIGILLKSVFKLYSEDDTYKLILKGSGDLYASKKFVEEYLKNLETDVKCINKFVKECIVFIDSTLNFNQLCDLYNSVDMYVSSYYAEGFGLTPLEAIASGTKVIIPETGATREYSKFFDSDIVFHVPSKLVKQGDLVVNDIRVEDIIDTIRKASGTVYGDYTKARQIIHQKYSWDTISDQLLEYFNDILVM